MPLSASYLEYVQERLSVLGKVTVRKMFGGAGAYVPNSVEEKPPMFAIIDDDQLYFKADDTNRADYTSRDLEPWSYSGGKKPMAMPYYPVPGDVLEDDDLLKEWGKKAIAVAKKRKPVTAKKRTS